MDIATQQSAPFVAAETNPAARDAGRRNLLPTRMQRRIEMRRTLLTLAAASLALAGGMSVAAAQQAPTGPTMQMQPRPGMTMPQQGGASGPQAQPDGRGAGMTGGMMGMMGRGDGPGMMGGMMGRHDRHGLMMRMMFIAIDANGDGALSQEEIQAVHSRMFGYADADKDGKLTLEELQRFYHGDSVGQK